MRGHHPAKNCPACPERGPRLKAHPPTYTPQEQRIKKTHSALDSDIQVPETLMLLIFSAPTSSLGFECPLLCSLLGAKSCRG